MDDIDFSNEGAWSPVAGFGGVLDGNGYVISNMEITGANDGTGMFASLDGAQVMNLGIEDAQVSAVSVSDDAYVGGLVGTIGFDSDTTIENCYFTG
jgi:hypothetical protein